jgi:thioredoxin 1
MLKAITFPFGPHYKGRLPHVPTGSLRKDAFSMILCRAIFTISIFMVVLLPISCSIEKRDSESGSNTETSEISSIIRSVASEDEFKRIVEGAGDRLLVFDLYANWCMPCRMLSPLLEKIAVENSSRATFFKINIDKLPGVAETFGVNGIPHISFIKNKGVVETVVGMQPEQTYIDIINRHSVK